MKMKALTVLIIFAVLIGSTGCISIEANQKINSDGSSEIEIMYDLSALSKASMGDFADEEDQNEDMIEMCQNFYDNTTWGNPNCIVSDYKVVVSGEIYSDLEIDRSLLSTTYRYDMTNINDIMSNVSDTKQDQTSDTKIMEMYGIEMAYTLEMPGEITETDMGEIKDNKVTVNMFDLIGEEHIYVESQEPQILGYIGIIAIMVIVMIGILVYKRRN